MKKIFLMLFATLMVSTCFAQKSEEELLEVRATEKVAQMCDYLEFLANPKNNYNTRKYYRSKALHLFINNGEPYEYDGAMREGVKMEITSLYRKPKHRLMKDYLTGLMNMRYAAVDIKTTDRTKMEISKLQKIDENTFVCTVYYEQIFSGYDENGRPMYIDWTRKKVKCFVYRELVESENNQNGPQYEYIVLLGDTTAVETRRLS